MSSLALIVPTFRRADQVAALLQSVDRGTVVPAEIVVVDNDPSPAGTDAWGDVMLIQAGLGLNLAGARNRGWRATRSEVCLFLDDDNIVEEDTLVLLQNAMSAPDIGMAGPVIYDADRRVVWSAGISRSMWTTKTRHLYCTSALPPATTWPTDDMPDAFAIPRRVLERVGGFDEQQFPFHYDEADIGQRIRALGYRAIVVREARVWHGGGTAASTAGGQAAAVIRAFQLSGPRRVSLMSRARVRFHRKYSRGIQRVVATGVFAPIHAFLISVACLRQPVRLALRLRVVKALFQGLVEGFAG